jgi:ribosomal protein S12 methylthiotransferase
MEKMCGSHQAAPMSKKTIALITFGCAKNLVDSEVMLGCLRQAGYELLPEPGKADVVILNTCGFIRPAKDEARGAIKEAIALKRARGDITVVVTGCYVERYRRDLAAQYPEVDIWLGVKDFDRIVPAIEGRVFHPRGKTFLCTHTTPRLVSTPRPWAYLKISEGCSHQCSFCAIPLIKGPYQSRSIPSIVAEARALAESGVREINLVSQDTTYFGHDKGTALGLVRLLRRLVDIPKLRWIRLLYGYPEEITAPLLEIVKEKKICSYLDIPFQHADRRILKRMKRNLEATRSLRLIDKIRRTIPDIALRTSLIVGFPGEGKVEFDRLKNFVREARFDHLGVFTYSPEDNTAAFRWKDSVPEDEKVRRLDEIMSLQAGISRAINQKYLHRCLEALLEPRTEAGVMPITGRTRFQAPEVDGVVRIEPGFGTSGRLRTIEKVEITAAEVYDLRGKIVR